MIEDLFIIVKKYCPLAETLAISNIAISDDFDIGEFVINEGAVASLWDDDLIAIG